MPKCIQAFAGLHVYESGSVHWTLDNLPSKDLKGFGLVQLLQISDPWLMAEFLDRNKYPELVDKPQEPMFYRSFDEVLPLPSPHSPRTPS